MSHKHTNTLTQWLPGGLPCDPDYCNNNAECVTGKQGLPMLQASDCSYLLEQPLGIRCVCEENQTQVIEHRCAS